MPTPGSPVAAAGQCVGTAVFHTAPLPDFDIVWEPDTSNYSVGDTDPWQWRVTRPDGGVVPVPTAAEVYYTGPDGVLNSLPNLYATGAPGLSPIVGGPGVMLERGVYIVELQLTLDPGDGSWPAMSRSARQVVTVS